MAIVRNKIPVVVVTGAILELKTRLVHDHIEGCVPIMERLDLIRSR
jgi:hypothetical protein